MTKNLTINSQNKQLLTEQNRNYSANLFKTNDISAILSLHKHDQKKGSETGGVLEFVRSSYHEQIYVRLNYYGESILVSMDKLLLKWPIYIKLQLNCNFSLNYNLMK